MPPAADVGGTVFEAEDSSVGEACESLQTTVRAPTVHSSLPQAESGGSDGGEDGAPRPLTDHRDPKAMPIGTVN